jgi:hypothetical protein
MKNFRHLMQIGTVALVRCVLPALLSLLFLCSCATPTRQPANSAASALPADASFNKGAGRGMPLYLTLRMESGEKLLFVVDTGSDVTILDKSLETKLGKRLSSGPLFYAFHGIRWGRVYQAPALYLGATRLVTSVRVFTDDLRPLFTVSRPIMGILGMDCLQHYCFQLDFDAGTIHFMDPDQLQGEGLGRAFPLFPESRKLLIHTDFFGMTNAAVLIDTGDYTDGALMPGLFKRELRSQKPPLTNQWKWPGGELNALFAEGQFGGGTYANLTVHKWPLLASLGGQNTIGLQFLGRHLVTLNFPKQTAYFQRRSAGPLPDGLDALRESLGFLNGRPPKDLEARFEALAKQKPGGWIFLDTMNFLHDLKKKGQLPGFLKNDAGYGKIWFDTDLAYEWEHKAGPEDYPIVQTLMVYKKDDLSIYNYTVVQASPDAPWKLQRAWKAAPNGRILKDYPVP